MLGHVTLRVAPTHRPALRDFYTRLLGMRLVREDGAEADVFAYDEAPAAADGDARPRSAAVEFVYDERVADRPYAAGKQDVYWKIGIAVAPFVKSAPWCLHLSIRVAALTSENLCPAA